MGVAALGYNVAAEVLSPIEFEGALSVWLFPGVNNVLKPAVARRRGEAS
jgi:hypothetical protein